jgi:hypothetical protein
VSSESDIPDAATTMTLLEYIAAQEQIIQNSNDIRKRQEAFYAAEEARLKLQGKSISMEADALKNRQAAADAWDQTFENMLGVSDKWKSSMIGKLMQPGGLNGFVDSLQRTFTASNLAVSSLTKAVEITAALVGASFALAKMQDDTLVAFNKSTGAARLYGDELLNLESSMNHHGVSLEIASESYGSMVKNVKGLKNMSAASRTDLAETTAVLDKFGVSADTTTQNFEFLTAAMGFSASEANDFSREMFLLAQEIGMPPAEMAQGLQEAAPAMAKFGSQSDEMYKKLAVNARAANMEVSQLLGIVEKFDTFEGAAQSVGQLNAILGGPFLNSMEMVQTTDPVERMKLLSDAANQAGASFDDMGYYERIALTEAMGLKDVSELALVMAGGFDETVPAIKQSQAELAAIAKQSADFNTLSEEMTQLMRMFATSLLTWVIPSIKWLAQKLQDLNQFFGGYLMPALGLLAAAFFLVASAVFALIALAGLALPILGGIAATTGATAPAAGAAAAGITTFATALAAATPVIATAGAALGSFVPVILAIGASIFMVGAGIMAVGAGIMLALGGVAEVIGAVLGGVVTLLRNLDPTTIFQKVSALNSLSASFSTLVLSAAATPSALWPLINALNAIEGDNLIPVADMFSSINSILDKDLEGLMKVEQAIANIATSINSIDSTEKVFAVKQLIDSVNAATSRDTTPGPASTSQDLPPHTAAALNRPIQISLNVAGREWISLQTETLDKLLNQY